MSGISTKIRLTQPFLGASFVLLVERVLSGFDAPLWLLLPPLALAAIYLFIWPWIDAKDSRNRNATYFGITLCLGCLALAWSIHARRSLAILMPTTVEASIHGDYFELKEFIVFNGGDKEIPINAAWLEFDFSPNQTVSAGQCWTLSTLNTSAGYKTRFDCKINYPELVQSNVGLRLDRFFGSPFPPPGDKGKLTVLYGGGQLVVHPFSISFTFPAK